MNEKYFERMEDRLDAHLFKFIDRELDKDATGFEAFSSIQAVLIQHLAQLTAQFSFVLDNDPSFENLSAEGMHKIIGSRFDKIVDRIVEAAHPQEYFSAVGENNEII